MSINRLNRHWKILTIVLAMMLTNNGCDRRSYYRQEADREVDLLVEESAEVNPTYQLPGFTVQMDPRSRYYFDQNLDCPPMPVDDPDSNQFMKVVDGKQGWNGWDRNGMTDEFENPFWREQLLDYVNQNEEGQVILDLDTSLRLAKMHSPSYQNQLETLYLSALDVSAERFSFDTQFFGGNDLSYSHLGNLRAGGEANTMGIDNALELRKRFATAGQLLVGLANSFVFTFTGNNTDVGVSLLNFSLVQPLLRNGGRVIALETLTIVERALFNNLRAFQRYRRGFFTSIAIGTNGTSGPQRRGGFLGGTGLTGFTGTGAGGIGGVGAGTFGFGGGFGGAGGGGGAAGTGLAGGGAGNVGGFIGLLQSLQQYRNARDSLDLQIRTLALLEGNLEGGVVDVVEVDQFRQTIETQKAQLLQSQNGLQRQVEGYLTGTLGLPPDLGVDLDDQFIRRFQLIDPVMTRFQNDIYRIQSRIGELEETPTRQVLQELIQQVKGNREALLEYFPNIRQGVEDVDRAIVARKPFLEAKELKRLQGEAENWKRQLDPIYQGLVENAKGLQEIEESLSEEKTAESTSALVVWMRRFLAQTQEIVLLQARSRLQNVYVDDPIRIDIACALKIAYANRLDYKNARSSLVDTWRLIEFNANRLKSDLSITASGDIRTSKNNIANFRDEAGSARLGVQFDAPFTRLLERNNYRGALIEYMGARRSFVQATDGINSNLRNLLRSLNELEMNLEIQRRAVDIAIRRVEVTEEKLQEPPNPDDPNRFGPTDVQNLSSALADLRNSQNNLMSVWLNYYSSRMLLVRDLGIMQLDNQGKWVETPIDETLCTDESMICEVPPEVPQEWIDDAFEGQPLPEIDSRNQNSRVPDYFQTNAAGPNEERYFEQQGMPGRSVSPSPQRREPGVNSRTGRMPPGQVRHGGRGPNPEAEAMKARYRYPTAQRSVSEERMTAAQRGQHVSFDQVNRQQRFSGEAIYRKNVVSPGQTRPVQRRQTPLNYIHSSVEPSVEAHERLPTASTHGQRHYSQYPGSATAVPDGRGSRQAQAHQQRNANSQRWNRQYASEPAIQHEEAPAEPSPSGLRWAHRLRTPANAR